MGDSFHRLYLACVGQPVADAAAPTVPAKRPLSPSTLRGTRHCCIETTF